MQSNPYEFSPEDLAAFREVEIASLLPFQVKRGPVIYPEPAADATASVDTNEPDDVDPEPGTDLAALVTPEVLCGGCGRERTLHDDYDYNPLQLVTGRPLGWYSNDDGELCGTCLRAMLSGAWPANHQANPEKAGP